MKKKFKEKIEKLKNNPFFKSVFALSLGSLIGQIIGLVTTPIVSRLYSLDAFGVYAVVSSAASIIGSFTTLGLNSAIMDCDTEDECRDTFMVAFILNIILNFVIIVPFVFIPPLQKYLNSSMNVYLSGLIIFLLSVSSQTVGLLIVYANKLKKNKTLFLNSIVTSLTTLLITIPLGFLKVGSIGLILAAFTASLINVLHMSLVVKPFKLLRKGTFKRVFKSKKKYILYQYPSNILGNASQQLPNQFLSKGFGDNALGGYYMSEKVLGIPSRLLGAPIGQAYFRSATEYKKENKDISNFTFKLIFILMLLSLLAVIPTIFWGKEIFAFVLGKKWGVAGDIAGILITYYVFEFCNTCVSYLRVANGKQKISLILAPINLIFTILPLIVGIYLFNNLMYTLVLFAIVKCIYLSIDMTVNFACLHSKYWIYYLLLSFAYIVLVIGFYRLKMMV